MKELLESLGYRYTGKCNCDGHNTHKFRNGDYMVRWRINQNTFRILKHGVIITNWKPVNEFENTIQEKV